MSNTELSFFLKNTIVSRAAIDARLTHPITKLKYPTRLVYVLLKKYAKDFLTKGLEPRLISLAGLRGVGKTTLLWQTANYVFNNYSKNIYFFNVNTLRNLGIELHVALEEFQREVLKRRFAEVVEPIIFLFDEVHDDSKWSNTLKVLYDEAKTALILCTGSSALLLNKSADLARRMRTEKIYPFKFIEYIASKSYMENNGFMIYPEKGLSADLKEALFYSEDVKQLESRLQSLNKKANTYFNKINSIEYFKLEKLKKSYISYQNIPNFLFYSDKYTINESILDLFKRVILEDIPKFNPTFKDFVLIEKLVLRLAGSDEINPQKLAGIIGIKIDEVSNLIDLLAQAELLNVLIPYGGIDARTVKNKKAFFMSPSLRRALLSSLYGQELPEQFRSKLIEDMVVMYLRRILVDGVISFSSNKNTSNPDFIIETRDRPIVLEIGTGKTTTKQIKRTNFNYRYGILVSNATRLPNVSEDCVHLPLNWFLLL